MATIIRERAPILRCTYIVCLVLNRSSSGFLDTDGQTYKPYILPFLAHRLGHAPQLCRYLIWACGQVAPVFTHRLSSPVRIRTHQQSPLCRHVFTDVLIRERRGTIECCDVREDTVTGNAICPTLWGLLKQKYKEELSHQEWGDVGTLTTKCMGTATIELKEPLPQYVRRNWWIFLIWIWEVADSNLGWFMF
jgi:hypothetical protein